MIDGVEIRHGEITSGMICGSLPVLPQLFRHYIPKVASRLRSHKQSNQSSQNAPRLAQGPSHNNRPFDVRSQDPYDLRLLPGDYLELHENDKRIGPRTTVGGGKQDFGSDPSVLTDTDYDAENQTANGQILKTVRLERLSN